MASVRGGEGSREFLGEVVGSVFLVLFPSFAFVSRVLQAIIRLRSTIEVHYCCCPGGLLGGIGAGRGGLYGLSMIGFAEGHPLFISFLFLHIEASASDQEIEVHHCYYLGGFLSGLGVGQGGLGLIYNIEVAWLVVLHLFSLNRGCHRQSRDQGPLLLLCGWTPMWPRCGAWRLLEEFLREWVSDRSFSYWLRHGCKL